jgi:hypothetical protein
MSLTRQGTPACHLPSPTRAPPSAHCACALSHPAQPSVSIISTMNAHLVSLTLVFLHHSWIFKCKLIDLVFHSAKITWFRVCQVGTDMQSVLNPRS